MRKCPGSVSLARGKSWKDHLTSMFAYIFIFCKSFGCQKSKNIKNISLTPTWNLFHASPKGPECRLCPALLFEGLFSRCDLSSVNGHSKVAVRSFSKSCESSVPRCQEEHVIRTQSRGKTLVPPSGLTTQEGKLFVRWFTPCCYTEGSKPIQTSLKSKSFEVPKVRHLKVIFFFESVFDSFQMLESHASPTLALLMPTCQHAAPTISEYSDTVLGLKPSWKRSQALERTFKLFVLEKTNKWIKSMKTM